MSKRLVLFILCCFAFSAFSILVFADQQIPPNNSTVFAKFEMRLKVNEKDLEKADKDVEKGNWKQLRFGNNVTVVGNKKINDKVFLCVQLPDKTKCWGNADYFAIKFITINQVDTPCYTQPDNDYKTKFKLQPGFFAYYVKEQNGFINVDFTHYALVKAGDKPIWLGNLWLKSGYTDELSAAKDGDIIARAYNQLYGTTPNAKAALKILKDGLKAKDGDESSISYVIKDLISMLDTGDAKDSQAVETKAGGYYTPTVKDLRLRETPSTDGKFIRFLELSEKLKIIEKGAELTANGVKGFWVKVENEKGETGWCFDGFLTVFK